MHGLEENSDISKSKFLEIMSKTFTVGMKSEVKGSENRGEEWNHIWSAFDRNNRGVANVGNIIKLLQKYEM